VSMTARVLRWQTCGTATTRVFRPPSTRSDPSEYHPTGMWSARVTDLTRSSSSSADEDDDANTLCVPSPLSLGARTSSTSSVATASTAVDDVDDAPLSVEDMKTPATMALLELYYDPRAIDNRRHCKASRLARESDAAKSQVMELKAKSKTGTWARRLKHARSFFV
jgi:hypothetical protein